MRTTTFLGLTISILGLALGSSAADGPPKPGASGVLCSGPRRPAPDFRSVPWVSLPQGFASTGLVAVPFDRASLARDLVVANGNDRSPQPLAIHYNQRGRGAAAFVDGIHQPEWFSAAIAMHGHSAAGDLDGDGKLDVVASVLRGHPDVVLDPPRTQELVPGGVLVYPGIRARRDGTPCKDANCVTTLAREPSDEIRGGFGATSVSLGDVNGDGWLDLAVAPAYETRSSLPMPSRHTTWAQLPAGAWRIYLNDRGKLRHDGFLRSTAKYNGGDVELADVNQDGLLDLVLAARDGVRVFFGTRTASGTTISPDPGWTSDPICGADTELCEKRLTLVASLDTAFLAGPDDPAGLAIAVGVSCLQREYDCTGGFRLYQPSQGKAPLWKSTWTGWGGEVALRDVNGDCLTDLVASPWWASSEGTPEPTPAKPRIHLGDGKSFADAPAWEPAGPAFVAQGLALADFSCEDVTREVAEFPLDGTPRILTIRDPDLELIRSVSLVAGSGAARPLAPPEVTWVIGEPWIAVAGGLNGAPGARLRVEYTRSYEPDLAIGSWTYDHGVSVFEQSSQSAGVRCNP